MSGAAGTNSYVLFTLDKLVFKLVKQLQHMHQDEITMKLAELHRYEAARSLPLLDAVYAANVRVLIAGDENTFRMEFKDNRSLTVQLLDQDRSEVMPGVPLPTHPRVLRFLLERSSYSLHLFLYFIRMKMVSSRQR